MFKYMKLTGLAACILILLVGGCKKEKGAVNAPTSYPVNSLVGVYYVTGYSQAYSLNASYGPQPFTGYDTIVEGEPGALIVKDVYLGNITYYYDDPQPTDSASKYTFEIPAARVAQSGLYFSKPYNDSVVIDGYFSPNPASGTNYHIKGKKVH